MQYFSMCSLVETAVFHGSALKIWLQSFSMQGYRFVVGEFVKIMASSEKN